MYTIFLMHPFHMRVPMQPFPMTRDSYCKPTSQKRQRKHSNMQRLPGQTALQAHASTRHFSRAAGFAA